MSTSPQHDDPGCPKCKIKKSVVSLGPGTLRCNRCAIIFDPQEQGEFHHAPMVQREDMQRPIREN